MPAANDDDEWAELKADPNLIDIGWGCFLHREVEDMSSGGGKGYRLALRLDQEGMFAGRYVATEVTLTDPYPMGSGVTTGDLRSFALGAAIMQTATDLEVEERLRRESAKREGMVSIAATAYRYGYALGHKPTVMTAELLNCSRSTASRLVAEARSSGVLEISEAAAAGGVYLSDEDG
jgi:hypothetical protein